jgi:outer membrane protein OmpA-like peptidoglycan-associated protein
MKLRTALIFAADIMLFGISAWSQGVPDVPKWEVPLAYSYTHFQAIDYESNHYFFGQHFDLDGGGGGVVRNFGHHFGIKAEFLATENKTRPVSLPAGNPFFPAGGTFNVQGNLFTYMFGPQVTFSRGRFRPFGEALAGGAHSNVYKNANVVINPLATSGTSASFSNNTFAAATGLGFDIVASRHISIRPLEVDYLYTNFTGNLDLTKNQHSWRYLGGIVFTSAEQAVPPTASCSISPTEVWAGEPVTVTISTQYFNHHHPVENSWSSSGGKVSGSPTAPTANVDTTGLAPGSYTVSGTATDTKKKKDNAATCSASFTIKQPHPPTASCSASPTTINPGDSFTVTVAAQSPENSPLSYSYTASAGNISGTGNSASGSTSTANANSTITATANVVDARGLSTTCSATVSVLPLPAAPVATPPEVSLAGECKFSTAGKAARVDNECKALLDDVALRMQREPNDSLVVVGYADDQEAKMTQLAGQRAVNVKYYLTSGEGGAGIDASRIQVRSGTVKSKSAKVYIVPSGATFTEESTAVDEPQLKGQPRNASKKKSK